MVGQLLPKRDIGGSLGRAIGQGLQGGFENEYQYNRDLERTRSDEQFQYERNRSRLQQAFGELESIASDEEASKNPYRILSKLGQAFAGIPGGQQVVSEVFPQLMQKINRSTAADNATNPLRKYDQANPLANSAPGTEIRGQQDQYFSDGGSQSEDTVYNDSQAPLVRNAPVSKDGIQNNNQFVSQREGKIPPQVQNQLLQQRNGQSPLIPTQFGQGPVPRTLSGAQLIDELNRIDKLPPAEAENAKKTLLAGQEQAQKDFQDLQNAQKIRQADAQAIIDRQDAYRTFAKSRLGQITPSDEGLFMELGANHMDAKTEDEWYKRTKKDYDVVDNIRNKIFRQDFGWKSGTFRPWTEEHRERTINSLQTTVKPMLELGLYGEATRLLEQAGWGKGEIDRIVNPLEKNLVKKFGNLPRLPTLNHLNEKELSKYNQIKNKYVDFIVDNVLPGQGGKPGTSLYELRSRAIDKGFKGVQFQDILNEAIKERGLKLDQSQLMQLAGIAEDPEPALLDILFSGRK